MNESRSTPVDNGTECTSFEQDFESQKSNWWALGALALVLATAAGNILVCLAIVWEKRLQNVTNYFLMSLAITDLMVAILVMPLGILTLVRGFFPLAPVYCLAWICLDVLFCTASIMHLCTISVDRYISLKYPMKFGRNKSRRRVVLKIILVWILSIAMSLPLSLMYSQDNNSLLVEGICQIPDPLYKLVGSIICFYIPLGVMLLTYTLTVRLLAYQQRRLGGRADWTTSWLQQKGGGEADKKNAWKSLLMPMQAMRPGGGQTFYSGGSADTEFTNLETNELWIQDLEPKPYKSSALHHFGQEMFKFSRGLNSSTSPPAQPVSTRINSKESLLKPPTEVKPDDSKTVRIQRYKSSTIPYFRKEISRSSTELRRRVYSYHETGTACTSDSNSDDEIVKSESCRALAEKLPKEKPGILTVVRTEENLTHSETSRHTIVPWRSEDLQKGSKKKLEEKVPLLIMRLAMPMLKSSQESSQPNFNTQSRNSIFITRNSSRNGRILRLEQKATKVLGVVFFTFVILWAPFFVLNLVPSLCRRCERFIGKWVFDFATWLGYSSSMVNPIFYTIFNKVFRQAFKNVLLCKYRHKQWEPPSKQ